MSEPCPKATPPRRRSTDRPTEEDPIGHGRTFGRELKLAAVRQVVVEGQRLGHVCREYGIAESLQLRCQREVAELGKAALTPPGTATSAAPERKGAESERFYGQLARENADRKAGGERPAVAERQAVIAAIAASHQSGRFGARP